MPRYQPRDKPWCSAASVQTALRIYGVRVGQARLARIIGIDDAEGADDQDVIQALDSLGCTFDVFESSHSGDARTWLLGTYNFPLLLCVDQWEHWVCVAGGCGPRLHLYDSAREPWNEAENGSHPLTAKTVLRRWKAARRVSKRGPFYGIALLSVDAKQARRRIRE